MTIITDSASADLHARRADGSSYRKIAEAVGMKTMTVYQHLRRRGILTAMPVRLESANDNNPERVTRMSPHNGGCSTLSGMMPVSVKRLAANDNTPDAESELAGRAVNEYAMRVAA